MSQGQLHVNPEYPEELPYRKVLDHGFVALVDVMGTDASIVQAARVSYGKGTKTVRGDKALISYLMRHGHSTPSEMVEFKFLMRLPLFIARQVIRHRTACLAGDAVLSFDLPGAKKRGRRHHLPRTIADFHRLWHKGTKPVRVFGKHKPVHVDRVDPTKRHTVPELARLVERREETIRSMVSRGDLAAEREGQRIHVQGSAWHVWARRDHTHRISMRDRLRRMKLRMCEEDTGEISHTRVTDIWESGVKPVFRVTLENGYQLKMTRDHRCLTRNGWMTLGQATRLRLRDDGGVTWRSDAPEFAVNGQACHRNREWLARERQSGCGVAEMADKAGVSYHTIRKYLRVHGLQFSATERAALSGRTQRGQRRTVRRRGPLSPRALRRIREARSGSASNFWKGGVTTERANIGRWTTERAQRVHERNGFRCVVCGSRTGLHAHHIDPVWHNSRVARVESNLTTLCRSCHGDIHRHNLELMFLEDVRAGRSLQAFWQRHVGAQPRPARKKKPPVRRLVRTWSRVARIEYVGEEMTYDLEVAGPFHNFVANGFVVHNSVNEYSARYSLVPDRFWVPALGAISEQDNVNRQGRTDLLAELAEQVPPRDSPCMFLPDESAILVAADGRGISRRALFDPQKRAEFTEVWSEGKQSADLLPTESYVYWAEQLLELFPEQKERLEEIRRVYHENNERTYGLYKELIDRGIAREVARCVLPLTMYTEWYWKIDLHNLLHFLRLRMDAHAQLEVRAFAEAMATFVKPVVPFSWEAFEADRLEGTFLSVHEKEVLRPVDDAAQREVLTALYERGYRRRRLKEVCRKLAIDELIVDELWPPKPKS